MSKRSNSRRKPLHEPGKAPRTSKAPTTQAQGSAPTTDNSGAAVSTLSASKQKQASIDTLLRRRTRRLRLGRSWAVRSFPAVIAVIALIATAVQLAYAAKQLGVAIRDSNETQGILAQMLSLQSQEVGLSQELVAAQSTQPSPGALSTANSAAQAALRAAISGIETQQAQLLNKILPSPTPSPAGAIIDNLNSPTLDTSRWRGPTCPSGASLHLRYGVLFLGLPFNDGSSTQECYIEPALNGRIPIQVSANATLTAAQGQSGFVGISSSCGDEHLSLLIAQRNVSIFMQDTPQVTVLPHNSLPTSHNLAIEWTGSEVKFTVDGVQQHSSPCYDYPEYLRFGVVAYVNGAAEAVLDNLEVIAR